MVDSYLTVYAFWHTPSGRTLVGVPDESVRTKPEEYMPYVVPFRPADKTLCAYVQRQYGLDPSADIAPVVYSRERNPHLDHECDTPEYDVNALCHTECVTVELAEIQYSSEGYRTLIAISTCGQWVVWAD